MKEDVKGTLKKVADMGYSAVETVGYNDGLFYGMAPLEFKNIVEDLGIMVTSAHLGQNILERERSYGKSLWSSCCSWCEIHNSTFYTCK